MGSRLKQNPERTFYWFFEATCPVARDRDPGVQFSFPEDFTDEETYQTIPRFCFPYDIQRARDGVAVQHFTFALTDLEGCQRFGFCRLTNTSQTCLCILSYLPWFEVFYKLLNNLADYLAKGQCKEARALLAELHKQPVPLASGSVTLSMVSVSTELSLSVGHSRSPEGVPYFIAPDPKSLPSIPENRNLTELIVAVDVGNLLQLYASMLFERRILIFASKLSTLTSCIHALSAMLYPMYWQHIFIPVLPPHLLDYCCAPMPYLIGVHSSLSERVKSRGLEEVIILNVDTNTLESPFDDFKRIPPDVMSQLKIGLKRQAVSPGCGVSRAFLRTQALLFGGYREALHTQDGEVSFNKDLFLDHKSNSMRQFLQSAVHLQCFKQFVDSRVDILNKGREPEDLFEEEIQNCEDSPGKPRSYQQLVGNIRKGGGALILNVKSNMKAKGLTKSGLKNLLVHKSHSEELSLQRGGSLSHRRGASHDLQDRLPITQHFDKSRPVRPIHRYRALRDEGNTEDGAWDRVESKHDSDDHREEEEVGEEVEDDPLLCDPEEMDLLGEIFDTLSSRSSHDRGVLYCTRSLDLFGPDSHDFITKRSLINPSQESLCISGSGSLHSWHQETAEDLSDLMEDWDQLSLHKTEKGEAEETLVMSDNQQQDGKTSLQRDEDTSELSGEQVNESNNNKETSLFREMAADVEIVDDTNTNSNEDSHATEKETFSKDEIKKPSKDETIEKPQELIGNQVTGKTDHGPSPSPSHQSVPVTPEKPVEQEARPTRATPPPPKVFSAAARFQNHATIQGPDLKSRLRTLAEVGGSLCSREGQSEQTPEEKDLPPINVSELKKRFEA